MQPSGGSKLSATEAVFIFTDVTNLKIEIVVLEYTGGALPIKGGPFEVNSISAAGFYYSGPVLLSATEIMVVLNDNVSTFDCVVVTWDGSSFATGTDNQLSTDNVSNISGYPIDATHGFFAMANHDSGNDLYLTVCAWDSGTPLASLTSSYTHAGTFLTNYNTSTQYIGDDASYWYFGVLARDNAFTPDKVGLYVFSVDKSTYAIAEVDKDEDALYWAAGVLGNDGNLICADGTNIYAFTHNLELQDDVLVITHWTWDGSGLTLSGQKAYRGRFGNYGLSAKAIDTGNFALCGPDNENSSYSTLIKYTP